MKNDLLSFVIPVLNEEESLKELHQRIMEQVSSLNHGYEIIFIDDGSTDSSWHVIADLIEESEGKVKAVRFRRNFGKARALATGFEMAQGDIVFTMDADLQDDPKEIPHFIEKLKQGYDIVSGWKKIRHDPWHKVLPSRVFNKLLSTLVGVQLHDHNCGFKCYRKEVVKSVALYGEMHRMVPSLASIKGFRSTEIVVEHHARQFGQSKYGIKRFARGFLDMLTVTFLKNYRERPLHLMGGIAVGSFGVAALLLGLSAVLPWMNNTLNALAQVILSASAPLFAIGLLSELVVSKDESFSFDNLVVEELDYNKVSEVQAKLQQAIKKMPTAVASGKALVVDDDYGIRSLLKFQLQELGFEVKTATNGLEALTTIEKDTEIVLLDLMMPEKDGIQCLREFRARNLPAQVIMVSANGQVERAVDAMKEGAFDYIQKPFDPDALETVVRNAQHACH